MYLNFINTGFGTFTVIMNMHSLITFRLKSMTMKENNKLTTEKNLL